MHFLDELNSAMTFRQKLWMTILLAVFGALIAPFLWLGTQFVKGRFARPLTLFAVETIAAYYATLLVYIWWRPPFLRKIYAKKERALVRYGSILGMGVLLFLMIGAVQGLIAFFVAGP